MIVLPVLTTREWPPWHAASCRPDLIAAGLLEFVVAAGPTAAALVMMLAKCGETNPAMRDCDHVECRGCGYAVHADVNAAVNIATADPY